MKIKNTPARKAILKILKKEKKPLDVASILKKLAKNRVIVNRTTVFRTINFFVKNNIVKKLEFKEGKFRYEITTRPHHHHLICKNCGSIIDIQSNSLHKQIELISEFANNQFGFLIEDHQIEFFGKCKSCQK